LLLFIVKAFGVLGKLSNSKSLRVFNLLMLVSLVSELSGDEPVFFFAR